MMEAARLKPVVRSLAGGNAAADRPVVAHVEVDYFH